MLATLVFALGLQRPITIRLQPVKTEVVLGDEVRFKAPTMNTTDHDLLLIPQGDSMQEGRKAPLCQIQFRQKGSFEWKVPAVEIGCGNTNLLRKEDFVNVLPGKSIDLLGGMEWSRIWLQTFTQTPGWYEFRLVYDTTSPIRDWLGGPLPDDAAQKAAVEFQPLHDQVPIGRFVSDTAVVRLTRRPAR